MSGVTIIMAGHNRREMAEKALKSIFAQSFWPLEVIYINDRSDDGTKAMLDKYPVKQIRIDDNHVGWRTPIKFINAAIKQAKYDIICLSGPDIIHKGNVLRKMYDALLELPENTYVYGKVYLLNREGTRGDVVQAPTYLSMFHRKHFMAIGGFDEDYVNAWGWDDTDFIERLTTVYGLELILLPDVEAEHLWHPDSSVQLQEWNNKLWETKRAYYLSAMDPVANKGREWGVLDGK